MDKRSFWTKPTSYSEQFKWRSAVVKKMMELNNGKDVTMKMLMNAAIGVPLRIEDMSYEEIQKSGWIDTEKYSPDSELDFVPPVPKFSVHDIIYQLKPKIMQKYLALDRRKYENHSIVILTPVHNSENDLVQYVQLLSELDYPKHKISVVFGEDGSEDQTLKVGKFLCKEYEDKDSSGRKSSISTSLVK
uniref:Uncharacterized protein LOC111133213 n=1 Tax=Crassostrea virginica TaxID=6565 RepID=A0A8B8EBW7_CRAVI|nr:uncharacterized protein LOC111133213 [Crassostrea virginica]XP_022337074.1 uncharacterized protein LOC111133213 [Crassostrea virginica]